MDQPGTASTCGVRNIGRAPVVSLVRDSYQNPMQIAAAVWKASSRHLKAKPQVSCRLRKILQRALAADIIQPLLQRFLLLPTAFTDKTFDPIRYVAHV